MEEVNVEVRSSLLHVLRNRGFSRLWAAQAISLTAQPNYVNFSSLSYFLLKQGSDYKALEAKLPQIVEK